jgi:hypothetical protein
VTLKGEWWSAEKKNFTCSAKKKSPEINKIRTIFVDFPRKNSLPKIRKWQVADPKKK